MHRSLLLIILLGLLWLPAAWGQTRIPEPGRPAISWNRSPGAVVFQVRTEIGMIAEAEKGPVITIYGDGTVEASYPSYMQRAGVWRMRIDDSDLQQLVDVAVSARLFDVDSSELADLVGRAAAEKVAEAGVVSALSDSEWTQLRLRLRMSAGKKLTPLAHTIRVRDLRWNARRFPELPVLVDLADFVERIQAFTRSPVLREVTP